MRLEMPLWVLVGMSEVEGKPLGRGPSTVLGVEMVPELDKADLSSPYQNGHLMGLSLGVQKLQAQKSI